MLRGAGERGSASAEFAMVGALRTLLTLSVVQLGLAMHVRNTLLDAAGEGARFAALADRTLADGAVRTRELITTAIGPAYATDDSITDGAYLGHRAAVVTVRAPLPVIGLIGFDGGVEVTGRAALEIVD